MKDEGRVSRGEEQKVSSGKTVGCRPGGRQARGTDGGQRPGEGFILCPWAGLGCSVLLLRGYQQILKQQYVAPCLAPAQACWHGMLRWEAGFLSCTRAWPFEGSG